MSIKKMTLYGIMIGMLLGVVILGRAENRKAPDFKLKTMDGESVQLSNYLNKGPVLIDFWATWCVPCLKEMDEFQKLYVKYHERGFEILGVTIDNPRTASKIKPTVKSKGFTFPILLDPNKEVYKQLGGKSVVPYAAIVNPDGEIISTYEGYKAGNEKVVEEQILPFLTNTPTDSTASEPKSE
jgi:cytochrome c biogenesis protein CcmG/thiol:disulfide interchange protein DsbE